MYKSRQTPSNSMKKCIGNSSDAFGSTVYKIMVKISVKGCYMKPNRVTQSLTFKNKTEMGVKKSPNTANRRIMVV